MREPIKDLIYHPDYDNRTAVYCLSSWGAPCPYYAVHAERYESFDKAYEEANRIAEKFTIPPPFRKTDFS